MSTQHLLSSLHKNMPETIYSDIHLFAKGER